MLGKEFKLIELSVEEMRKLDAKGLNSKLDEFRREFFNLKMKKATTGIEKSHYNSSIKKTIAQLQTVLTEKGRS